MKILCGIDLGTQSCKIVLYDYEKKRIVETAQVPIELIAANDGTREQKAEWYREALKASFAKLSETARKSIIALGVSGQQHGFVPLDAKGKSLYNVKLWCDTSTQEECEELTKASGGTPIMRNVAEYNKIPYVTSYYGQGLAMLALSEKTRG